MMGVVTSLALAMALQSISPTPAATSGLTLEGEAAEAFLRTAAVVSVKSFETRAITRPKKVELSDGERTGFAVFKTIDESEALRHFDNGTVEFRFSDSFKYEIAAYELDKLLGLGIVPPTVKRRINRQTGSLSLWVEGAMTEWERLMVKNIHPPDLEDWNRQMHTVRLFLQLIDDTDYRNINNLLVTTNWKIYKIDASRAFRDHLELRKEESLQRFSRPVLASLRSLRKDELDERLEKWLSKRQITSLWVRRNLILELAERRVAEEGEAAVLFD